MKNLLSMRIINGLNIPLTTGESMDWPDIQQPSGLEETTVNPVIRTEMESGIVLTRPRYTRLRRTWVLSWENLRGADYRTLRKFFVSQKGGAVSFSWKHPKETAYDVRFVGDITARHTTMDFWNISVTLEQI